MRIIHERLQTLLAQRAVDIRKTGWNRIVENHAAHGRVDNAAHVFLQRPAQDVLRVVFLCQINQVADDAQLDRSLRRNVL